MKRNRSHPPITLLASAFALAAILVAAPAFSQALISWVQEEYAPGYDPSQGPPPTPYPVPWNPEVLDECNAFAQSIRMGPDSPLGITFLFVGNPQACMGARAYNYLPNGWSTEPTIDLGDYFEIQVGPVPGALITLTSFSFDEGDWAYSPRAWAVRSSLDGYASDIASGTIELGPPRPAPATWRSHAFSLGPEFQSLSGPVNFRIYGWNSTVQPPHPYAGPPYTENEWLLDNVEIEGVAWNPSDPLGDCDTDGVPDVDDLCPGTDPGVAVDGNGCSAVTDSDGDGVPDDQDICPGGDDNVDTDEDGVPDFCDPCPSDPLNDSDGDGSCDSEDLCLGDDSTGDSDGDGVCDDSDPCAGSPNVDTDGDGICDGDDTCFGDDATGDSDGDGVCDDLDVCQGNDASGDTDGDGTCDDIDACPNDAFNDADDDGVCGDIDNCPEEWNPAQTDTDDDGAGDECDADDDEDGIADVDDNCPLVYNPGQGDFDGDGAGDFCDADDDQDGVQDDGDECPYTAIGAVVAANGCSIAQLCPCENDWKNHGAYVRCVAHTTNVFVDLGLITEEEKGAIMSEAGQSDCGSKK